jgi:hypothetical protein
MMNQSTPVIGVAVTTDTALHRVAAIGPLPTDGAFSITGTVTGVGTGTLGERGAVTHYVQFAGFSTAGVATVTSSNGSVVTAPPMAVQPQDGGVALGLVIPVPVLIATGNTLELEVQGPTGTAATVNWGINLVLNTLSLP